MRSHVPSSHHLCFSKLTSDALRESRTIRPPFRSKKPSRDLDLDAIWEFLSPVTLSMILLNLVFELGGALPSIAPHYWFFQGAFYCPHFAWRMPCFSMFSMPNLRVPKIRHHVHAVTAGNQPNTSSPCLSGLGTMSRPPCHICRFSSGRLNKSPLVSLSAESAAEPEKLQSESQRFPFSTSARRSNQISSRSRLWPRVKSASCLVLPTHR